jgi:hypothetical protein
MSADVQTAGVAPDAQVSRRQYLVRLRQILATRFDAGELNTLCFDLGVDYDDLPGESRADKARELIGYLERCGRVSDLVELGRERRPDIPWEDIPTQTRVVRATEMEFVNRGDELHQLHVERLRTSRSSYTLISAPAGYGKSYLLRHLIHIVESDEDLRRQWCVRYVDLDPKGEEPRDQIGPMVHFILGSQWQDATDLSANLVCDAVVRELSTPIPEGRRAVLLIFDTVERLGEEARRWLYALLSDLHECTRVGRQEIIAVRVIISGRGAEFFWEDYARASPRLPVPQRITLSPFGAHCIQELIWRHARAARIADRLDDQTVNQMAEEVGYLSGGHPGVIHGLIDHLASRSFAVGRVPEYFARNRAQLARTILSPVAADLLASLEPEIANAAQTLSVFRRVNANTVQALIEAGMLPSETNEVELLGDMQRALLLDGPGIREPFYRDRLIRHVLALSMAYGSPQAQTRYRLLHRVALDLYEGWIHNLGLGLPDTPLKATQRLLSVAEWLFHALQDEEMDRHDLCSGLQRHVSALSEGDQSSFVADLIAAEIRQDAEACYLLRQRLGDDGISVACSWLQAP